MESSPSPRPKTVTVAFGRSSFIGRSIVAALLHSSDNLALLLANPLPPPVQHQSGRILHFQTDFDDPAQLRTAIEGSSSVFLVDPTLGAPSPPPAAADFYKIHKEIVGGVRNVVRVCRECGVERLVYTGTADVVFDGTREIVAGDESLPYPDKYMDVINDLRAQAEMLVLNANGRDGLSTCVLRASNPFGPGDDHFVPLLVAKARSTWAKIICTREPLFILTRANPHLPCQSLHPCTNCGLRSGQDTVSRCDVNRFSRNRLFSDLLNSTTCELQSLLNLESCSINDPILKGKVLDNDAKFIIGSGTNMCDFTYVENVAHANICLEQVLCSEAASVAGKPFIITNHERMKFWDFNSSMLEGLGYQRPNIHLPIKLVLLLVALVKWVREKLHLRRTCNPFLTPVTAHVFSCTRTFDSSKAQRIIRYSPVTSLEDGISATVESFSQLTNGLAYLTQRDFSKASKAELLLGSGKVADILLWRDEKRTFTYLLGLFLLFHWFLLSERTFIASTAKFLLLVSVILFSQGFLPSSMFGFTIEKMPSSYFEVSELAVKDSLTTLASIWNSGLFILKSVSQGGNWNIFLKVTCSLYLIKLLLPFPLSVLIAVGVFCLFSFFIIYEQCEEEVEKLMKIAASGSKKLKELLSAKFSGFLATYVHKN